MSVKTKTAYDRVQLARSGSRPTGKDYIDGLLTDFFELHGDRLYGDDPAVIGGIALLGETPITAIAIEKGHNARERAMRRFGAPNPEGYRKALRLMKQAEKFHRPVLCFVDTSGAYCGIGAEERGQGRAIAENLYEMSGLKTPIISILIGEGGSGGALALAVADRVWMLENSVYSVISPEGCASILFKEASRAAEAAESLCLTAGDAFRLGIVDSVLSENALGSEEFYSSLRRRLTAELSGLLSLDEDELVRRRSMRFRAPGSLLKEDNQHEAI